MSRNLALLLAAIVFAAVAAGGGYWLAMQRMSAGDTTHAGSAPGENVDAAAGRKVLYWHDPMVPGQRFDTRQIAFHGHEARAVYADGSRATTPKLISSRVVQNIGIRTRK